MRRLLLTSAVALAIGGLASVATAADSPVKGGTANVIVQPEPPGLVAGMFGNAPSQVVAGSIYEGLVRLGPDLKPQPAFADSWEISPDGLVYTFKLHPGVKFHDGHPATAEDVVFSFDKFLRELHTRTRGVLEHVEKIEALDPLTVRFTLKHPFGPLMTSLEVGSGPIMPKHIYEGSEFKTNPANAKPIGTGPFKFKEWVKGSYIHLVRNDEFHEKGQPYLDEIYYHIIPDGAARAIAYETGKIDVLPGGSIENFDVDRLAKLPGSCMTTKGWEFFAPLAFMWLNNREGPMADKRFRQAVMYAMDRDFARDVIWNGLGKVATGPVARPTKFYTDDVKPYPHDPAKAKALLKEMGYKGQTVRLLPLPYGETWLRWGEAVRQNLEDVGIKIETVATDVPGWNQKLAQWDYDIAFTFIYQYGDPAVGVARSYVSSQIAKGTPWNNVEGYSNPEVDALFEKGGAAPAAERAAIYAKIQKLLVEDVPVAWLTELEFPTIYRCKVKNLVTTAIGVNDGFQDTWIEK